MSSFLYRGAELVSRVFGVPSSQLFPSPSKFFLLRKLVVCLNQSVGMSVGLDAACADFKYRDLFRTDRYVGVDLEPANLNKGLALRARSTDMGVLANLCIWSVLQGWPMWWFLRILLPAYRRIFGKRASEL